MSRQLVRFADAGDPCAVSMWDYVIPAALGGGTGLASGFLARWLLRNEHPKTADAAAHIVEGAVTLLVGGMVYVMRVKNPRLRLPA